MITKDILEHIRNNNIVLVEHRGMRFIDYIDLWDSKFTFRRTGNTLEANIKNRNNDKWYPVGTFRNIA